MIIIFRDKRFLFLTDEKRLVVPPGTQLVLTPTLALPFLRYVYIYRSWSPANTPPTLAIPFLRYIYVYSSWSPASTHPYTSSTVP